MMKRKRMIKVCLLFAFLWGVIPSLRAKQYMVVIEETGKERRFELSENPVITYFNDFVKVESSTTYVIFSISKIKNIVFTDGTSSIDLPSNDIDNGEDSVEIYTADGVKIMSLSKGPISLSSFPRGIYIIKTPSNKYKIINK